MKQAFTLSNMVASLITTIVMLGALILSFFGVDYYYGSLDRLNDPELAVVGVYGIIYFIILFFDGEN